MRAHFSSVVLLAEVVSACFQHTNIPIDYDSITHENELFRRSTSASPNTNPSAKTVINNVRVFDGTMWSRSRTVIIEGGLIGTDPAGATNIIDGQGGTLLPGLIDSHAHPSTVADLQSLSHYGVTTVFMMACYSSEACRSLQNHTGLTDVLLASGAAAAPGSVHGNISVSVNHSDKMFVQNASVAPAWVRNQVEWGPDYIKVIAESPGLDQETLNVLTSASHTLHKRFVCHAAAASAYEQAITAKVDQIHHSPLDRMPDAQLLAQIKKQHQVSTPTLTIMKAIAAISSQG